ncbi:MAG: enoyl-CoA hydratase [Alphaproteobacteria bacterium]|jgi:enoyl-CoA hydratase/carnithine racemase|nr:enoyl-CoA hydratase [Alphaproteobacteria bacterium]
MTSNTVLYETEDNIATVTLNRPERLNALNDELVTELYQVMQQADQDKEVRINILTGAGRGFCAGGDIHGFNNLVPEQLIVKNPTLFNMNIRADYQTRHAYLPSLRKPVIGMVNGPAAGLGLLYALGCDIRFAADSALFTTAFAKRGLAAEFGMSWLLPRVVGHANAMDLLLSARTIGAEEALQLGLVNKIFPPDKLRQETLAYAREMVTWCSPTAMRHIEQQTWDTPFQSLQESVRDANQIMLETNRSPDFAEGTASFHEKRPPNFQPID